MKYKKHILSLNMLFNHEIIYFFLAAFLAAFLGAAFLAAFFDAAFLDAAFFAALLPGGTLAIV